MTKTTTTTTTHPNFKSAVPNIHNASDINIFIGDVLEYQYMFEKKIPPNENWEGEKKNNYFFSLKLSEIDRLFLIGRHASKGIFTFPPDRVTCYHFAGRIVNSDGKLLYVYLKGRGNRGFKTEATGYIFISENVYVFLAYLFENLCPYIWKEEEKDEKRKFANYIYDFLLKTDGIKCGDEKFLCSLFHPPKNIYEDRYQSFTLQNLCYHKIKNDSNYQRENLPKNCQFDLNYINKYEMYSQEKWHFSEFCKVCVDSERNPKLKNHLLNDYYVLENVQHRILSARYCICSVCELLPVSIAIYLLRYQPRLIPFWNFIKHTGPRYKLNFYIHVPNIKRLCVDTLNIHCDNILNFQHLLKKVIPPSEMEKWSKRKLNHFKIYPRDIDRLYFIWNGKNYHHAEHLIDTVYGGYTIEVTGRVKKYNKVLYFNLIKYSLFNDNNDKQEGGFIFLSEDLSSFMYCILENYRKKDQIDILRKISDDGLTNKLFCYDTSKVQEFEGCLYQNEMYSFIHSSQLAYYNNNYMDSYNNSFKTMCSKMFSPHFFVKN